MGIIKQNKDLSVAVDKLALPGQIVAIKHLAETEREKSKEETDENFGLDWEGDTIKLS